MYHLIGSILPGPESTTSFAQLYIHDTDHNESIDTRVNMISNNQSKQQRDDKDKHIEVVGILKQMFYRDNYYASIFKTVGERLKLDPASVLHMGIARDREADPRRYNLPSEEVAVIMPGDGSEAGNDRDIIIQHQNGEFQRVSALHPSYTPLSYPILFPYGEGGFRLGIQRRERQPKNPLEDIIDEPSQEEPVGEDEPGRVGLIDEDEPRQRGNGEGNDRKERYVTQMEYFRYRLQFREADGSQYLLRAKRLFHQFVVDMYACMEMNRLNWIRNNQNPFVQKCIKVHFMN